MYLHRRNIDNSKNVLDYRYSKNVVVCRAVVITDKQRRVLRRGFSFLLFLGNLDIEIFSVIIFSCYGPDMLNKFLSVLVNARHTAQYLW